MDIKYIGHTCFYIKGSDVSFVIDPYDPGYVGYKLPRLKSDVVLVSHEHKDHNFVEGVSDYTLLINRPGEYEIRDTFIYGIDTFHDDKNGSKRGKNTCYLIEDGDFTILHLGDLGHTLSQETLEKVPDISVLLIPVGGTYTIDAKQAVEVISSLEPGIVVPMHYSTEDLSFKKDLEKLDKFLNEMGVKDVGKKTEVLSLRSKSDVPSETRVVVLEPQH